VPSHAAPVRAENSRQKEVVNVVRPMGDANLQQLRNRADGHCRLGIEDRRVRIGDGEAPRLLPIPL
jgi:hypothetical protein